VSRERINGDLRNCELRENKASTKKREEGGGSRRGRNKGENSIMPRAKKKNSRKCNLTKSFKGGIVEIKVVKKVGRENERKA